MNTAKGWDETQARSTPSSAQSGLSLQMRHKEPAIFIQLVRNRDNKVLTHRIHCLETLNRAVQGGESGVDLRHHFLNSCLPLLKSGRHHRNSRVLGNIVNGGGKIAPERDDAFSDRVGCFISVLV